MGRTRLSPAPLHGPTAEDRRAANSAPPRPPPPPSGLEQDTALRRASRDRRLPTPARALAWAVSAYNRAPPRVLLEDLEPPGLVIGFLPPLSRRLGLWSIGRQRAGEHLAAARGAALWSSGWSGSLVLLAVWVAVLLLLAWLFMPAPGGA